jgi:hypothetical protein
MKVGTISFGLQADLSHDGFQKRSVVLAFGYNPSG